jgi:hypothetical protein
MKHLRKFDSVSDLNAAIANSTIGILGLAYNNGTPVIKKKDGGSPVPPTPSHDYVEIGGIKWATMNIGASTIYDTGLYFQWGDTQGYTASQVGEGSGQKYFSWSDYKFNPSGDGSTFTKYNYTDGKTTLDLTDDAVHAAWGGNWRMPTKSEIDTFIASVDSYWDFNYNDSGVGGFVCADNIDNTKVIFFPACGFASSGTIEGNHSNGSLEIWCSELVFDTESIAVVFGGYYDDGIINENNEPRYFGLPCRGILDD